MVKYMKEIGPQRYREVFGRDYEDFEVGDVYEHRPGRTISEADNTWFTLLTMNTHPLHFDAEYGKLTEFDKPLVVSTLTLSILVGMSVSDLSQKAIANLGWGDHQFLPTEEIPIEVEELPIAKSSKRPLYMTQGSLVTDRSIQPEQWGSFLIDIYNEWV